MSAQFSFSFSGDDIEDEGQPNASLSSSNTNTNTAARGSASASAFPVAGKPLLPATSHDLKHMLAQLPSKVAYNILDIDLDSNETIHLPRRELWDVRVQLMAEEEDGGETEPGLGNHDVKTGVYEGGFKSWESSVDLVRTLALSRPLLSGGDQAPRIIELGCGTALPSLALFNWALSLRTSENTSPFSIVLADYNPTVLQLVTLPNFILTWALHRRAESSMMEEAFSSEGELDLTPEILEAFQDFLSTRKISLHFFSGAWSPEFVELVTSVEEELAAGLKASTVILGAETIYSPFALSAFTQTVFSLLQHEKARGNMAEALVGAKKLYFGVGGSLDDFVVQARDRGATVEQLREETEGVRRGVVRCSLPG
ncbi:hypothetical protein F5X96DRAFT_646431 [Biscogniauxia mediterranea]|nr:hypothetical protein F5X96DRAFT_646431 [Biscogniauxia mediterranea]